MEVIRIVGLADLIAMLADGKSHKAELAAVSRYRDRYGSNAGA